LIQRIYDSFERGTLFTQRLLFQLGVYFFKTLFLGIVVKDTP